MRLYGSIPASAGEPRLTKNDIRVLGVYPRECGGTRHQAHLHLDLKGLSPRVRGNPGYREAWDREAGSIPASAGEPRQNRAAA